ncbi:hypothetical protein FKM82_008724 [Ascaphus truei]
MGHALVMRREALQSTSQTLWVRTPGGDIKHLTQGLDILNKDQEPKGGGLGRRSDSGGRREILFVITCCVVYLFTPISSCVCPLPFVSTGGHRELWDVGHALQGTKNLRQKDRYIPSSE